MIESHPPARPRVECSAEDCMERIAAAAPDVHRFVAHRVANPADAADISQQALLLACTKLETFRGDNLPGWLFAIARNLITDYHRTKNRFRFVVVEPATEQIEPALRTHADAVADVCEFRRRLNAWLDNCTRGLRLEQQVAVLQADIYDYRDKDAAAMLQMSVPSFKLLLHGARARLRGTGGQDPARPATPRRRQVACRLDGAALMSLHARLVDGVRRAALTVTLWVTDWVDFELLDMLIEL